MSKSAAIPHVLRVRDVARICSVSVRQIWRWRANGTLPAAKVGGCRIWRAADVERFADSLADRPPARRGAR